MSRREDLDADTRRRIVAWIEHLMAKHSVPSKRAMADRMAVSNPHLINILNNKTTPGLDFVVKLHRTFFVSLDVILDSDPPKDTAFPNPPEASQPGQSGKRTAGTKK